MTDGENGLPGRKHLGFSGLGIPDCGKLSILLLQSHDACAEMHRAAKLQNPFPEIPHCGGEPVRTDMGLCLPENLSGSAACRKGFQHKANPGILGAGVQLPVGKGACAPLSELHIAVRIQGAPIPEAAHRSGTGVHIIAPFQQHGLCPCQRQHISSKEPCRAAADDHRGQVTGGCCRHMVLIGGIGQHILVPFACRQQCILPVCGHQQGGSEMDGLFFPGIHRPPEQLYSTQLLSVRMEPLCRQIRQSLLRIGQGKGYVAQQNHGFTCFPFRDRAAAFPAQQPDAHAHMRL